MTLQIFLEQAYGMVVTEVGGWNWTLTHSVGELDTAVRREEATFSNYSRIVLRDWEIHTF